MATVLPRTQLPNPSAAERKLLSLFSDLPDPWRVLHSVAWQAPRNGRQGDGEADFVLIHPKHGLLVVEAKGGVIDIVDGQWQSVDRHGVSHPIKNPYGQAVASKHALVRFLRQLAPEVHLPVQHAVALPDVEARGLGPIAPSEITWDVLSMKDLAGAVAATVDHWSMEANLRRDQLDAVCSLLLPTTTLRPLLRDEIASADLGLEQLTDEQLGTLEGLRRNRRAVIYGGAGTGKTVLSLHRATRLAEQGFSVLLTCFNAPLAAHLATQLSDRNSIRVSTFHQLCTETSRLAGLPTRGTGTEWWDDVLPRQLEASAEEAGMRFDAIVVDEGQDFAPDWWVTLQLLLTDPDESPFYVFADTQQAIYRTGWAPPFDGPSFELFVNCRNTVPIARRVASVFRSEMPSRGVDGPEAVWHRVENFAAIGEAFRKSIHAVVKEQGVHPADVAVLSNSRGVVDLLRERRIGNLKLGPIGDGDLVAETIHRFKGLEAPAVVLIIDPSTTIDLSLLYIGASRARAYLHVISDAGAAAKLGWEAA